VQEITIDPRMLLQVKAEALAEVAKEWQESGDYYERMHAPDLLRRAAKLLDRARSPIV